MKKPQIPINDKVSSLELDRFLEKGFLKDIQYFIERYPNYQIRAIELRTSIIKRIKWPSEEIQRRAIQLRPNYLLQLHKASPAIIEEALAANPYLILNPRIVPLLPNKRLTEKNLIFAFSSIKEQRHKENFIIGVLFDSSMIYSDAFSSTVVFMFYECIKNAEGNLVTMSINTLKDHRNWKYNNTAEYILGNLDEK